MRPIIYALIANPSDYDGSEQRAWVPLPLPGDFREVALLADRLGISSVVKAKSRPDDVRAYRSILSVKPVLTMAVPDVEHTATGVSRFTTEQLAALDAVIRAFDLQFTDIDDFLDFLCNAKKQKYADVVDFGIPVPGNQSEITEGETR